MVSGHVFIATSLDGYIARTDGSIDWLMRQPVEGEDHGYDAFIADMDVILMGRQSYETVLTFDSWPYSKPVVVLSSTLRSEERPEALVDKVQISALGPRDIMRDLTEKGIRKAYIDGGRIIQSFLREGLIQTMTVTRIPVLIGKGRPLFGDLARDIDLDHLETRHFPSGLVQSTYRIRT